MKRYSWIGQKFAEFREMLKLRMFINKGSSSGSGPGPTPTCPILDTFDESGAAVHIESHTPDDGGQWAHCYMDADIFVRGSHEKRTDVAGTYVKFGAKIDAGTGYEDCCITAKIVQGASGSRTGIIFRWQDENNFGMVVWNTDSNADDNRQQIIEIISGTEYVRAWEHQADLGGNKVVACLRGAEIWAKFYDTTVDPEEYKGQLYYGSIVDPDPPTTWHGMYFLLPGEYPNGDADDTGWLTYFQICGITEGMAATDYHIEEWPCGNIENLPEEVIVNLTGNCEKTNESIVARLHKSSSSLSYRLVDFLKEPDDGTSKFDLIYKDGRWLLKPIKNNCVLYSSIPPYFENCVPFELRFGPFPVTKPCCERNSYVLVQVVAAP